MLKLLLIIVSVGNINCFPIECFCGIGNYSAVYKDSVYLCFVVNMNITTSDKLVTNVIKKHDLKKTNFDVKLLKIHNQSCPEIPERIGTFFSRLEGLEIINSNLRSVIKEDLSDFKNLKYLNLKENKIEVLRNDTFKHNTKLQHIIICCNELKLIGISLFEHLNQLKHVNFKRNVCISRKSNDAEELASLRKEISKKCPPSIEVYCTYGDQDFPAGRYYTCEVRFWIVVIDYMAVADFQGRLDSGRKNCEIRGLRVREMTTKFLPINLCKHFPKLEALEVVGGRLTKIEKKDIKPFPNLKVLWLPRNNIETLSNDVFEANHKLEKISFYENRLQFIGIDVFKPLKHLKYVNLEFNDCIDRFAACKVCIDVMTKEIGENCI